MPQSQSSLPTLPIPHQSQQPRQYFCYQYISQTEQAWTCFAYFFIAVYLLYRSVLQYKSTNNKQYLNWYIKYTYISIFATLILYMTKLVISEVVFWVQFATVDSHGQDVYGVYSNISKFVTFIDISQVFFIMSAILFVPANWVNNMIELSKKQTIIQHQRHSNIKLQTSTTLQKKYKKILQIYLILRLLLTYIPFIPFFILDNQDHLLIIGKFMLIWIQVQFFIVFILLLAIIISINRNDLLRDILYDKDIKLIKKHYYILILCTVLRFITDVIFTVFGLQRVFYQSQCFIKRENTLHVYSNIIVILLEAIFTQFFTVVSILNIYRVDGEQLGENLESFQDKIGKGNQESNWGSNKEGFFVKTLRLGDN